MSRPASPSECPLLLPEDFLIPDQFLMHHNLQINAPYALLKQRQKRFASKACVGSFIGVVASFGGRYVLGFVPFIPTYGMARWLLSLPLTGWSILGFVALPYVNKALQNQTPRLLTFGRNAIDSVGLGPDIRNFWSMSLFGPSLLMSSPLSSLPELHNDGAHSKLTRLAEDMREMYQLYLIPVLVCKLADMMGGYDDFVISSMFYPVFMLVLTFHSIGMLPDLNMVVEELSNAIVFFYDGAKPIVGGAMSLVKGAVSLCREQVQKRYPGRHQDITPVIEEIVEGDADSDR